MYRLGVCGGRGEQLPVLRQLWGLSHFFQLPEFLDLLLEVLVLFLYFFLSLGADSGVAWHSNVNDKGSFQFLLNDDDVWSAGLDDVVGLDVEVPQQLNIVILVDLCSSVFVPSLRVQEVELFAQPPVDPGTCRGASSWRAWWIRSPRVEKSGRHL